METGVNTQHPSKVIFHDVICNFQLVNGNLRSVETIVVILNSVITTILSWLTSSIHCVLTILICSLFTPWIKRLLKTENYGWLKYQQMQEKREKIWNLWLNILQICMEMRLWAENWWCCLSNTWWQLTKLDLWVIVFFLGKYLEEVL